MRLERYERTQGRRERKSLGWRDAYDHVKYFDEWDNHAMEEEDEYLYHKIIVYRCCQGCLTFLQP